MHRGGHSVRLTSAGLNTKGVMSSMHWTGLQLNPQKPVSPHKGVYANVNTALTPTPDMPAALNNCHVCCLLIPIS